MPVYMLTSTMFSIPAITKSIRDQKMTKKRYCLIIFWREFGYVSTYNSCTLVSNIILVTLIFKNLEYWIIFQKIMRITTSHGRWIQG